VPLPNARVTLKEVEKSSTTDAQGRYLFRDLPAGKYIVSVITESREISQSVMLPASPRALTNVDLEIGERVDSPPPQPAPVPAPHD
jgi:hypothetical protein